jgi:hypothetical protein
MSYSFTVKTDSKEDAIKKVAEEFDNVVAGQPTHAADREAAVNAAKALVGVILDPKEGEEVHVHVNGSLSWHHDATDRFTAASVSVHASVHSKE